MVCNESRFERFYTIQNHHIETCTACGLTQLNPLPTAETIKALYDDSYYAAGAEKSGYTQYMDQKAEYLATFAEDIKRIEAVLQRPKPLKILDVGCGPGYFVEAGVAAGHDVDGVDIIPSIIEQAKAQSPGRIFLGVPDEIPELRDQKFDAVFASHVIEHVPDPVRFTARLVPFLKPHGIVVYVTPNIRSILARVSGRRWVSFKVPEHVAYYAPDTIGELFERAGLKTVVVDSAYQYYHVPFIAMRLRSLIAPLDRLIPPVEHSGLLKNRILRITSGSLRGIATLKG